MSKTAEKIILFSLELLELLLLRLYNVCSMELNDIIFNRQLLKSARRIKRIKTLSIEQARKDTSTVKGSMVYCRGCNSRRKAVGMPIDDIFYALCHNCHSLSVVGIFSAEEKRWQPAASSYYIPDEKRFDSNYIKKIQECVLTLKTMPSVDCIGKRIAGLL